MNTKRALIIYTGLIAAIAMILISTFIGYDKKVEAAPSCRYTQSGICPPVEWHEWNADENTKNAALANPGTQYMAACYNVSSNGAGVGTPGVESYRAELDKCGCPVLSVPASGCVSAACGTCGNPTYICSSVPDNGGGDTPPPPPPPPPAGCPYDSTQARVHTSVSEPWTYDLSLDACTTPVIVGSFHNHDGNFANDTDIQVVGPEVNVGLPNEGTFNAISGEYTVYVRTRRPGTSDYYPEDACNATARVVCPADNDGEPNFDITKVATNDDGPYDIGDIVNFRVQIENTGDETLDSIAYRDVFDHRYLQFVSVRGFSPSHPSGINMSNNFTLTRNGNLTTLSNDDITAQLGDLAEGQIIYFEYEFRAINPNNRACNDVFARPEGLSEEQARDCVGITISTDI